jgi:hypothetical protein
MALTDFVTGAIEGEEDTKQAAMIGQLGIAQQELYRRAAGQARNQGVFAAEQSLLKGGQTVGAAQAAIGASGVDGQSGSTAEALMDSRMFASLDARTAMNNASRAAWGFEAQGTMALAQSQMRSIALADQGQTALTKGLGGTFGSMLALGA